MIAQCAKRYLSKSFASSVSLNLRSILTLKYNYSFYSKQINTSKSKNKCHPILVIGGSAIDMTISPLSDKGLIFGRTNEGRIHSSYGGVGRNIA